MVLGFIVLWKGITNDIWRSRFGDTIVPRWLYLAGGVGLILLGGLLLFLQTRDGRSWLSG
jgi:hypothetical protein